MMFVGMESSAEQGLGSLRAMVAGQVDTWLEAPSVATNGAKGRQGLARGHGKAQGPACSSAVLEVLLVSEEKGTIEGHVHE